MRLDEERILKTAIYMRVSTDEQAKEGFSINAQQDKLTKYAIARDWEIYDYYVDDVSGKNIQDRPDMLRLLKDLDEGKINNVLVYKIDRLTRSTKNLIELTELFKNHDCEFNSLMEAIDTSSATGRMFLKIVGIFAEFERENLAERVSFGYEQKAREGNYLNTVGVYGYDYIIGGELNVNEKEKETVKWIYDEYLQGESMTQICKKLIEKNVPTKRGGQWAQSTVGSILTNPLYIGIVRYGTAKKSRTSFEAQSSYEHILDEETFYSVQEILKKRKRCNNKQYSSDNTYFLGALSCAVCGGRISVHQNYQTRKTKEPVLFIRYYCCNSKNGKCNAKGFSSSKMENAFVNYISNIENIKPDPTCLDSSKKDENVKKLKLIEIEIKKLEKKHETLKNLFISSKLEIDEYRELSGGIKQQLISMKKDRDSLQSPEVPPVDYNMIKGIIGNIRENWLHLTNAEKKQFIHRFISTISAYNDNGEVKITDIQFMTRKKKDTSVANSWQQ